MHIPIIIPIGTNYIANVQGKVWKLVSCANCREQYAYLLELQARGEGLDLLFLNGEEAKEQARTKAVQNLANKSRNVVLPVPCPNCGFYQDDMARRLKEDLSLNSFQIVGVAIALLSFVPLAFDIPYIWSLTIVMAIVGLSLLSYGYVLAFRFEPNAGDPEPRKAIGRKHAVWADQLVDLLATNPLTVSDAAPDHDRS